MPPVNGQFLADRIPDNRYILFDAEHRVWEEAAKEFNDAIISWYKKRLPRTAKDKIATISRRLLEFVFRILIILLIPDSAL